MSSSCATHADRFYFALRFAQMNAELWNIFRGELCRPQVGQLVSPRRCRLEPTLRRELTLPLLSTHNNNREAGQPSSPSRSVASSRTRTSGTRTSPPCSKRPRGTGSTTSGDRTIPADLRTRRSGTRSSARGRSCLGVRTRNWSRLARTRRATRSSASALTIENRASQL